MPWKLVKADYDVADLATLHDDELIAIVRSLHEAMGQPRNEYNPRWRAWTKLRPMALQCTGHNDPVGVLPAGAAKETRLQRD